MAFYKHPVNNFVNLENTRCKITGSRDGVLLRFIAVSLLAIKEHDELQEKFETERKLKNAIVVEAQRVSHFSSHNLFSHQKQPKKSPPQPHLPSSFDTFLIVCRSRASDAQ